MSKLLANRPPSGLEAELQLEVPRLGVVPLLTIDPQGYPHTALLSYYEMFLAAGEIHFFVLASSRTRNHLRAESRCALQVIERDHIYYLKGEADLKGEAASQALFHLSLRQVLEDLPAADEDEVELNQGLGFRCSPAHLEKRIALRSRMRALLRRKAGE